LSFEFGELYPVLRGEVAQPPSASPAAAVEVDWMKARRVNDFGKLMIFGINGLRTIHALLERTTRFTKRKDAETFPESDSKPTHSGLPSAKNCVKIF
jgi:hypothetical protein